MLDMDTTCEIVSIETGVPNIDELTCERDNIG